MLDVVAVHRSLVAVASCSSAWALGRSGFWSCSTKAQQLWHMGLVALKACGISLD